MKRIKSIKPLFLILMLGFLIYSCEDSNEEVKPDPVITLTETDGETVVSEDGLTDAYTVVLGSEPAGNVTIQLSNLDDQLTLSQADIVFTTGNWNVPQEISIGAIDDDVSENYHSGIILHESTSSDKGYNNLTLDFTVSITDNEFSLVISGSRTGHYCIVDPFSGEDYCEPDPDVHYVGQLCMGYLSQKAIILSPEGPGGGSPVIYTCDAFTGANVFQVVSADDWHVYNIDGSPVGPEIVFSADDVTDWNQHIHKIAEDGTNYAQLTFHEEGIVCDTKVATKLIAADYPAYSPDGQQIAFAGHLREINTNFAHAAIIIMENDGSSKTVLYSEPVEEPWYRDICWTKDGKFLIFSQADGGNRAIKALHIESKTISEIHASMQVGNAGVQNHWTSPLEQKIIYMLISPGGSDLYWVKYSINGNALSIAEGPVKITDELGVGHGYQQPDWSKWDGVLDE